MPKEIVRGNQIEVQFDGSRCIHARNCVLGRPDVFVPNVKGEWIHPENTDAAGIAELANNCPSGAIQYTLLDGAEGETPPLVNTVRMRENGPLAIHAPHQINDADNGMRAVLCRCGQSKKKPFCDGSHNAAGFEATGEIATQDSTPLEVRDGAVMINPSKDGPLIVSGNLEIVSGTGRTINRVTKTALCRCGHSANKPYCDGTHAKIGFKTD